MLSAPATRVVSRAVAKAVSVVHGSFIPGDRPLPAVGRQTCEELSVLDQSVGSVMHASKVEARLTRCLLASLNFDDCLGAVFLRLCKALSCVCRGTAREMQERSRIRHWSPADNKHVVAEATVLIRTSCVLCDGHDSHTLPRPAFSTGEARMR